MEWSRDGRVLLRLRRPWSDGTRAIGFEPVELIEKLAAMIPRPRTNMLVYHGAFGPRGVYHERRPAAPPRGEGRDKAESEPAARPVWGGGDAAVWAPPVETRPPIPRGPPGGYVRPVHHAWADLLRRTFAVDVLACECGGRLRLLATIEQPSVVAAILRHLGLPVDAPAPAPARMPWLPGIDPQPPSES